MPERVLIRFTKDGHWAEIRERKRSLRRFSDVIEFVVFVNGSLVGGEMFQPERHTEYLASLDSRIQQFTESGWTRH